MEGIGRLVGYRDALASKSYCKLCARSDKVSRGYDLEALRKNGYHSVFG